MTAIPLRCVVYLHYTVRSSSWISSPKAWFILHRNCKRKSKFPCVMIGTKPIPDCLAPRNLLCTRLHVKYETGLPELYKEKEKEKRENKKNHIT